MNTLSILTTLADWIPTIILCVVVVALLLAMTGNLDTSGMSLNYSSDDDDDWWDDDDD